MPNEIEGIPQAWLAIEAERNVIGSILIDPSVIIGLQARLSQRDFFDESLGKFYGFLIDMAELREPIDDLALLTRKLKSARIWTDIGRAAGLAALATECPNPKHSSHYAAIVREAADRRRLSVIAKDFYDSLMDPAKATADLVAALEARIQVSGLQTSSEAKRIWEASEDAVDRLVKARESKYDVGVQTGLYSVDQQTGGLFPEELTVLAARPSIGKSAFASQVAYASAMAGRPALFVSLEMAEWELAGRTLAAESSIDARMIRSASVTDEQIVELRQVVEAQKPLPLWFWRPQRATVSQIRAKAREISAGTPLALVVVDYMQLVKPDDPRMFRRDQMAQIGRDLKELANEMRVAMLCLSQLNREGEGSKPSLSQLSESGTIEQDANAVWLLHREHRGAEDALLMVEKNRSGVTGELPLRYDGSRTLFHCPQTEQF